MRAPLLFILAAFISISALAQDDVTPDDVVLRSQQIKLGSSIQYDWGRGYYYYDYNFYYSYSPNRPVMLSNYDGPNTQLFVAYEYIWTYPTKLALAIEPKLGAIFREYMTNGFVGANWKLYWANKEIWRMGMSFYTGYEYKRGEQSIFVDMENFMYSQQIDVKLNEHVMSFELVLVPFQFKPKGVPLIIECNLSLLGLHVFKTNSSKYNVSENETTRYKYSDVAGYGPRIELKLGWQFR